MPTLPNGGMRWGNGLAINPRVVQLSGGRFLPMRSVFKGSLKRQTARTAAFAFSGCPHPPLNLRGNRAVGNLVVFRQQHGFGEDDRERVVALKRDKQLVGCVFFAAVGYDAEVLVVRQH